MTAITWAVGWNQPGFSPNPDNVISFESWDDAFVDLGEALDNAVEEMWEAGAHEQDTLLAFDESASDDYRKAGKREGQPVEIELDGWVYWVMRVEG